MTRKHDPHGDQRIGEVLLESGLEDSLVLRESLFELRSLALADAPEPRPELAALLAPAAHVTPGVASLERKRWAKRRRTAVLSAAVVGAMGLGASAVAAANEDFRHTVGHTVGVLLQPVGRAPAEGPVPSPAPSPSDLPGVHGDAGKAGAPESPSSTTPATPGTAGGSSPSPSSTSGVKHPLQPMGPVAGHDGGGVDQRTLPVLPSPAQPSIPGLPSPTPGKTE